MKTRKNAIILLLTMALTLFSSVVFSPPAVSEANSAPRETIGYDSSGVIVKTENSPIVVDKEDLTFHIYSADRFIPGQEYDRRGTVTAEYTFRNPTNLTVETRCLFPFGFVPYDESQTEADKEYFKVKTNGKDADKTIRHTYKADRFAKFDLEEDLRYFSDDFIADDTLSTDLTVYEYVLDVKGTNGKLPTYVKFSDNVKNHKYIVADNYVKYEKNGDIIELVARQDGLKNGQLTLTFIGNDVADIESKFSFFDDKWKSVGGRVVKGKKVEYNFKDYVLKFRPAGSDVSDVDWYNATVALIKSRTSTVFQVWELSLSTLLFRWYDYTLTFAPEETLVNTVSAPLYPSVNRNYVPPVYSYTYLLSPAAGWADFNNLTIRIYTDMYLLRGETRKSVTNPDGSVTITGETVDFAKNGGVYEARFEKLPDGDLTLFLCASENPERYKPPLGKVTKIFIILSTGIGLIVIATIILVVTVKKQKTKGKKR